MPLTSTHLSWHSGTHTLTCRDKINVLHKLNKDLPVSLPKQQEELCMAAAGQDVANVPSLLWGL